LLHGPTRAAGQADTLSAPYHFGRRRPKELGKRGTWIDRWAHEFVEDF